MLMPGQVIIMTELRLERGLKCLGFRCTWSSVCTRDRRSLGTVLDQGLVFAQSPRLLLPADLSAAFVKSGRELLRDTRPNATVGPLRQNSTPG
mmetsp:Transcript_49233/g.90496  ORF Transcript_49233/g.90496 Transcript_49233/m.90496 type:complete len:93 (-) Transcript_49233:48-326(-)